nr:hypothetical protein [Mycoavidus cysteinexigens]
MACTVAGSGPPSAAKARSSAVVTLAASSSIWASLHSGLAWSSQVSGPVRPGLLLSRANQRNGPELIKTPSHGKDTGAMQRTITAQQPRMRALAARAAPSGATGVSRGTAWGAGTANSTAR